MYVIRVTGSVLATKLTHYAQSWACRGMFDEGKIEDSYCYDEETHMVKSDLILNECRRSIPYAAYHVDNNISCKKPGSIASYPGYGAAVAVYKENIANILNQLNYDGLNKELVRILNRGLFIDVFSSLELFLSDVLLCLIYRYEKCYGNAIHYWKVKNKVKHIVNQNLEKKVHQYFFKGVVYHKFSNVETMFEAILGVCFPDYSHLGELLRKRNNIVHRYSLSGFDRMSFTEISKKDIEELVETSDCFVKDLVRNIEIRLPSLK